MLNMLAQVLEAVPPAGGTYSLRGNLDHIIQTNPRCRLT